MVGPLYHGGVPFLRVGELIEPHETKRFDDCPTCRAGRDGNHRPDRVFATPVRLYAKWYASKWVLGWIYQVEPVGELESGMDSDSIESWCAPALRVVRVVERAVELTMSERRRLYRMWTEADRAKGLPEDYLPDRRVQRLLGMQRW